jgi:hypothetical protein
VGKIMLVILIMLCFSSCEPQIDNSEAFLRKLVTDSINIIGKDVPNTYSYESEDRYTKKIEKDRDNPAEAFVALDVDSGIVESCELTVFLSDFDEARLYYNQLIKYIENENWDFIKFISKYKRPNGALYLKGDIYYGIYEPIPLAIPMRFSKDIDLNCFYEDQTKMINDTKKLFEDLNSGLPVEKMPIEYYTNIILQDETSQRHLELKGIREIEYLIPGFLCFMVEWEDFEGYVYKLYTFNSSHKIVNI